MDADYIFRRLEPDEVPSFFDLVLKRISWMDEKGMRFWNVMEYDKAYPVSYYEEKCGEGELYGLFETDDETIRAGAVLKEQDERWEDDPPAFYLHNFVSDVNVPGAGSVFLETAMDYAFRRGKDYFRLDSAADNEFLADYYGSFGFEPCGTCTDGPYNGILRQKRLKLKVYFAASIRGGRQDAALYADLIRFMQETDIVLTEHIGTSDISLREQELSVEQYIYNRDIAWLKECDVIIAECTCPSLGVGYELAYAEKLNKPCYIFYRPEETQLSAMLKGDPYYRIFPYRTKEELFLKTEQILTALRK